eukprot:10387632-Karenia_brevis.AAC.1
MQTLFKIQQLPHHKHRKCVFVRVCAHARGLYGCEGSPVDEGMLKKYTSMVMRTIGTHNQMHC